MCVDTAQWNAHMAGDVHELKQQQQQLQSSPMQCQERTPGYHFAVKPPVLACQAPILHSPLAIEHTHKLHMALLKEAEALVVTLPPTA